MRTRAAGIVYIHFIAAAGDGIFKFPVRQYVVQTEDVIAVDHAALAHPDFRSGHQDHGIFETFKICFQKIVHLKYLFARLDLRARQIARVHRIHIDDARRVEMQDARRNMFEN